MLKFSSTETGLEAANQRVDPLRPIRLTGVGVAPTMTSQSHPLDSRRAKKQCGWLFLVSRAIIHFTRNDTGT
jgi:hypothetical protein